MPPTAIATSPREEVQGLLTKDPSFSAERKLLAVSATETSDEEINETLPRTIHPPLKLENHPVDERLPLKAIVVGAGITGITAGILLPAKVPGLSLTIYERHSDIVRRFPSPLWPILTV